MTFWYMQVHPGSQPREYNADVMYASILRTRDVGMGDEDQWGEEGRATQARFREDVHEGDVAVIAHGKKLMLLVRFGKFGTNRNKSDDGHWYGLKRDVEILSADHVPYALEFAKRFGAAAADGLPIRQTLARVRSNEFVKFWHDAVVAGTSYESSPEGAPPARIDLLSRSAWQRNGGLAAKSREKGVCELCGTENTFPKDDGRQYFEGHHLVPMKCQGLFRVSLDVPANVVCLCPQCHRLMHYGQRAVRKLAAEKLYVARSEALNSAGIAQTKAKFLSAVLGDAD